MSNSKDPHVSSSLVARGKRRKTLHALTFNSSFQTQNVVPALNSGWRKCLSPGADTPLVIFQIQLASIDGGSWSIKWAANLICGSQMAQMVAVTLITGRLDPIRRLCSKQWSFQPPAPGDQSTLPSPYLQGSSLEGGCRGYNHATVLLLGYNAFPFLSACEVQSEKDKGGTDDIWYI